MIGYWDPACPVKSDNPDVKVTVYERPDSLLIAYASWAKNEARVTLKVNWNKLGMEPENVQITAPAIENFQPGKKYANLTGLKVPVGGGGIILVKKQR